MAWIIGLANDKEIKKILEAGYKVHNYKNMPEIGYFAMPEGKDAGIAVFVDCDVSILLDIKE